MITPRTAMRKALCHRLRSTGLQVDGPGNPPCDGQHVECGICDRTVTAMLEAQATVQAATRPITEHPSGPAEVVCTRCGATAPADEWCPAGCRAVQATPGAAKSYPRDNE